MLLFDWFVLSKFPATHKYTMRPFMWTQQAVPVAKSKTKGQFLFPQFLSIVYVSRLVKYAWIYWRMRGALHGPYNLFAEPLSRWWPIRKQIAHLTATQVPYSWILCNHITHYFLPVSWLVFMFSLYIKLWRMKTLSPLRIQLLRDMVLWIASRVRW